jgi:hypothetical protein
MRPTAILTTLALTLPSTHASASTTITNSCSFPVYYALTDSHAPTSMFVLDPDSSTSSAQYFDGNTGTALKITRAANGLWTGAPVLNFGYTVKEGQTWYDISTVYGYDFWGERVVLSGAEEGSEEIVWEGAPGPVHVAHWFGDVDLVLEICAAE